MDSELLAAESPQKMLGVLLLLCHCTCYSFSLTFVRKMKNVHFSQITHIFSQSGTYISTIVSMFIISAYEYKRTIGDFLTLGMAGFFMGI